MAGVFDQILQEVEAGNPPAQWTTTSGMGQLFHPESTVSRALDRGIANFKGDIGSAIEFIGQKLGLDWLSDSGRELAERSALEAALNPADVQSWEDVDSLADVGTYVLERAVENIPTIASMFAGWGVGGGVGRLLAAGVGKRLLETAGKEAAKKAVARQIKRGALAGSAAAVYPQHVGEMWQELKQAGVTADDTVAPFFTAAINTALDVGPFERLISFTFKGMDKDLAKDLVKQAAKTYAEKGALRGTGRVLGLLARQGGKGAVFGALVEGPTEALQEIVNMQARALHDPEFDPFGPEALDRIREAFIAGAGVGATFGAAGRTAGAAGSMTLEALGHKDQSSDTEEQGGDNPPPQGPTPPIDEQGQQNAPPAPETTSSLMAQVDELAAGRKPGVLVSDAQLDDPAVARLEKGVKTAGLIKVEIPGKGTLYVHPQEAEAVGALKTALATGAKQTAEALIGRLTGIPESAAGAPIDPKQQVVQNRNAAGEVVTQARAPVGQEQQVVEEMAATAPPGGTTEVVTPEEAVTANRVTQEPAPPQSEPAHFRGQMKFAYGRNKRPDVSSKTTFEAILKGERTATTRTAGQPGWGQWVDIKTGKPKVKPGDIITWEGPNGKTVVTRVTAVEMIPRGKARETYDWEEWSRREGWTPEFGRKYVGNKAAIQIQFERVDTTEAKRPAEDTVDQPPANVVDLEQERARRHGPAAPTEGAVDENGGALPIGIQIDLSDIPESATDEDIARVITRVLEALGAEVVTPEEAMMAERGQPPAALPPADVVDFEQERARRRGSAQRTPEYTLPSPDAGLYTAPEITHEDRDVFANELAKAAKREAPFDAVPTEEVIDENELRQQEGVTVHENNDALPVEVHVNIPNISKSTTDNSARAIARVLEALGLENISEATIEKRAPGDVFVRAILQPLSGTGRDPEINAQAVKALVKAAGAGEAKKAGRIEAHAPTGQRVNLNLMELVRFGLARLNETVDADVQTIARGWAEAYSYLIARGWDLPMPRPGDLLANKNKRRITFAQVQKAEPELVAAVRDGRVIARRPFSKVMRLEDLPKRELAQKRAEARSAVSEARSKLDNLLRAGVTGEALSQAQQEFVKARDWLDRVEAEVERRWQIALGKRTERDDLEPVRGDVSMVDDPETTDTRGLESEDQQAHRAMLDTGDMSSFEPPRLAPGIQQPNVSSPAPEAEVAVIDGSTDEALSAEAEAAARLLNEVGVRSAVEMADDDGLNARAAELDQWVQKAQAWLDRVRRPIERIRKKPAKERSRQEKYNLRRYEQIEQSVRRVRHNLANIRRTLSNPKVKARTIFIERGTDARGRRITTPLIFLRKDGFKTKTARAEALIHELGHIVLRDSMTSASDETLRALREVLGGEDFTEFEENFANAFLAWTKQKALNVALDPASERVRNLVKQFFRGLWNKLRKLWRAGTRDMGVDQRFSDFMEGLVNRQRLRRGEEIKYENSPYVRYAMELGSGVAMHTQPYAAEYLDFTVPFANSERARRIKRFWKPRIESTGRVLHQAHDRFLRGFNAWLRQHKMAWLADEFLPRPGEQRGRSDPGVFRRIHAEGAPFWNRLSDMARAFGPTHRLRDLLRNKNPEVSAEYRNLQDVLLRGAAPMNEAVAEQARQIRAYLEDLRVWLDKHHVRFRKRKDYFPVLWSAAKLKKLGVEKFVDRVVAWARANPADAIPFFLANNLTGELDALLDADLVGLREGRVELTQEQRELLEGRARAMAASLYDHLLNPQSVMMPDEEGGLSFASPAFTFGKHRKLPNSLIEQLADFREDDIFEALYSYTHAAIKRGVWQQKFGLNDLLDEIDRVYREKGPQEAALLRDRLREDLTRVYGVDLYDPAGALVKRLVDQYNRGEISKEELDFVREKIIPAYQGRLGADMHPIWRRFQAAAVVYQNLRVLALGVFSQVVDFSLVLHEAKAQRWQAVQQALKMAFNSRSRKEWMRLARELGAIRDDMTDHVLNDYEGSMLIDAKLRRLNEKLFRYNGMHYMTNFARAWATRVGAAFLLDAARNGDADILAQFGTDPEAVRAWERAGKPMQWSEEHASVLGALHQFIDQGVLRPTPASRPVWGNDQKYAIFWHLKSFPWEFTYSVIDRVWQDMQRQWRGAQGLRKLTAVTPFLSLAVLTMMFAALGMEARWLIAPPKRRPEDAWDYLWTTFERAGVAGMAQSLFDMDQAASFHRFALVAVGGPTLSQFEDVISRGTDYNLVRALPAYPIVSRLGDILE